MHMLGCTVAGVICVADVDSPPDITARREVVRDRVVGKMQVNLIHTIRGALQDNVICAACAAIGAVISQRDDRACPGRNQREMTNISEIVSVMAILYCAAGITQGRVIIKVKDGALELMGSAGNIRKVIAPDGLQVLSRSLLIDRLQFGRQVSFRQLAECFIPARVTSQEHLPAISGKSCQGYSRFGSKDPPAVIAQRQPKDCSLLIRRDEGFIQHGFKQAHNGVILVYCQKLGITILIRRP